MPTPPGSLEFVGRNILGKAEGQFHEWRIVERQIDLDSLDTSHAVVEIVLTSVWEVPISSMSRPTRRRPCGFILPTASRPKRPHGRASASSSTSIYMRSRPTVEGEIELIEEDPASFEGTLTLDRMVFGVSATPGFWSPMTPKAKIPVRFRVNL